MIKTLISYRLQDKRRLRSKITKISKPHVFDAPLKGFPLPLQLGTVSELVDKKKQNDGATGRERSLTTSLAVTDGRTDRRPRATSEDIAYA